VTKKVSGSEGKLISWSKFLYVLLYLEYI